MKTERTDKRSSRYKTGKHRRVWIKHNGPIPKDDKGRSFHIHHIDGDPDNNHISNLKCVSIEEHLKIHEEQGDYWAVRYLKMTLNRPHKKGLVETKGLEKEVLKMYELMNAYEISRATGLGRNAIINFLKREGVFVPYKNSPEKTPEHIAKVAKAHKGRTLTQERKDAVGIFWRGRKKTTAPCSICGVDISKQNMKRHIKKCKRINEIKII